MAKKSKAAAASAPKPRGRPKTKPDAPGAAGVKGLGHNSGLTDDEKRALFLKDKAALTDHKKRLAAVVADIRNVKKRIKADGFTVLQVEQAIEAETAEGEAKIKTKTAETLQAMRWIGVSWGDQLDLFGQPDRTPAVDTAKDAGKMASMQNQPRNPPHSPETPQYAAWMDGYNGHQATLASGFKPTGDGYAPQAEPEAIVSGEKVTRAEFKRRLTATTAAGEAMATGGGK